MRFPRHSALKVENAELGMGSPGVHFSPQLDKIPRSQYFPILSRMNKIIPILLSLWVFPAFSANNSNIIDKLTGADKDFRGTELEWQESKTDIPPLPESDDAWTEVPSDLLSKNQKLYLALDTYHIDEKDRVARYWILIRSNGGGYAASYEGMKCSGKEYSVYAWGRLKEDPSVRPVDEPKWQGVGVAKPNNYRYDLMDRILCIGITANSLDQVKQSIRGKWDMPNANDYSQIRR